MAQRPAFEIEADAAARTWLEAHPTRDQRVIAYDVHRCCGGGKICLVSVREKAPKDRAVGFVAGSLDDGAPLLIDLRAARRLPARFGLTVRGAGPFKHLDLKLEPDQWGDLLYT